MRIPEDRFETGPPQFVEVLALVDHDGIELVLRPQSLAGLHQRLRGQIVPEFPGVRVAHLPEGNTGLLAKRVGEAMVVLDDEAVAEGLRDRVAQPILERAVVAEEQRARAGPGDGLRLGQCEDRLAGARHALDRRGGPVGEDVEDPFAQDAQRQLSARRGC